MMDEAIKQEIGALGRKAHALAETAYRNHAATRGDPDWAAKQRILLADMSLHLLKTAIDDGELSTDELKRNLYAILTIAEQFCPGEGLKHSADKLYANA